MTEPWVWRAGDGWRMVASTVLGGGIGARRWVINVQVPHGYARMDPDVHLAEEAAALRLRGDGVGMLTAAPVADAVTVTDNGVRVTATVGLGRPTWAAAAPESWTVRAAPAAQDVRDSPGTVNIVVAVPAALTDAALVGAMITVTEAKTQALLDAGAGCTGTASDAVCIAAYDGAAREDRPIGAAEPFGGPRSLWGSRIARATHAAVYAGARHWLTRAGLP